MKNKNSGNKAKEEKKKAKETKKTAEKKKKSFFAGLFDRMDKKLEEKAKNKECCCGKCKK